MCGEGGEYETLVLDCPLFTHARIVVDEWHLSVEASGSSVGLLTPVRCFCIPSQGIVPVCHLLLQAPAGVASLVSVRHLQEACQMMTGACAADSGCGLTGFGPGWRKLPHPGLGSDLRKYVTAAWLLPHSA